MNIARLLAGVFAAAFLITGIAVFVITLSGDDAGYDMGPEYTVRSDASAIVSDRVDLTPPPEPGRMLLATVRFNVRTLDGRPVFVGVGPSDDVARFLSGVAYDRIVDVDESGTQLTVQRIAGGASSPPASQTFWDLGATTASEQTVTWDVREGEWSVVIMDAEGRPGIAVGVSVGVRMSGAVWIGAGLLLIGLLLALAALFVFRAEPGGRSASSAGLGRPA